MPKHRGLILEHQTSRPASLSDFFMENATISQEFAFCSAVRLPQPPQAMVNLRLELGNKRFWGQGAVWGETIFFEISII